PVGESPCLVHDHYLIGRHALVLRLALGLFTHIDLRIGGLGPGELDLPADRRSALHGGRVERPGPEGQCQSRETRHRHQPELPHPASSMRVLHPVPPYRPAPRRWARRTTTSPRPSVTNMAPAGEMNTPGGVGRSSARKYQVLRAMREPCSPLEPSQTKNATGMARPASS